jgi:hypothetical protein
VDVLGRAGSRGVTYSITGTVTVNKGMRLESLGLNSLVIIHA